MQTLYFTVIAIVLYFIADALLDRIERARARRFEYRSLVFFVILLTLALIVFGLIRRLT
ncbi:MAG: hypothetical protein U1F68_13495 [Gammaproteobacteria bacterium]